jgi:retron-type reverse transcriptase
LLRGGVDLAVFLSVSDITYDNIISLDNLLGAWEEFLDGKRKRKDVQVFQYDLMNNIFELHNDLKNKTYTHGSYEAFNISDPKPRNIHKACVRDRLLHHTIYRQLYPFFDSKFIYHSYSCRRNKGTHKALASFTKMAREVSANDTKICWVLKCDIKKFFASIDHKILLDILQKHIKDEDIFWLLGQVVVSFQTEPDRGLPLGNLTSHLMVNVYMNEFDQFVKHNLRAEHYIRYADDFVVLSQNHDYLLEVLQVIHNFLEDRLVLRLHPNKVSIETLASGVDFLGWVHFPHHRTLRTTTKHRVQKGVIGREVNSHTTQSYLGILKHGNTYKLKTDVLSLAEA